MHPAVSTLIVLTSLSLTAQTPSDWVDPSPHQTQLIDVAPDTNVEVLDWGGTGRTADGTAICAAMSRVRGNQRDRRETVAAGVGRAQRFVAAVQHGFANGSGRTGIDLGLRV